MTSLRPAPGHDLCALDDLPDPGSRGFAFPGFRAFVVRLGAEVRGYLDVCPHAGWPLAMTDERRLTREGDYLLCTGHGALFRLEDGLCIAGPCAGRSLEPWPVTVREGRVLTA